MGHSLVKYVIRYPVKCSLTSNTGRVFRLYRAIGNGKVSVGLSHVKTMVNKL